jgi:Mg2+ and Co2+ transporter CorA
MLSIKTIMTDSNDNLARIEAALAATTEIVQRMGERTDARLEDLIERMGDRATFRHRLDRTEDVSSDNAVQIGKLARHVDRVAESVEQFSQVYDRDRRAFRDLIANHDRIISRQDEIIKLLTREVVGPTGTSDPMD